MNNGWNRFIYRVWSPVYDYFFNKGPFLKARKAVFESQGFEKGEKVLFAGVGTGADIERIPVSTLEITAIDYSEEMLKRAKKEFQPQSITFEQMDAQDLRYPDNTFDYVIASLILPVVPDSEKAFAEMFRVLRPGGQILIFDKFAQSLSFWQKLLRPLIRTLGTDIGLSLEKIIENYHPDLEILEDQEVMFRGMYRKIKIRKN